MSSEKKKSGKLLLSEKTLSITSKKKLKQFIRTVQLYYKEHGRTNLPWRRTKNPYRILVSEIMLQQTQVDRVIPKYRSFLKRFPSLASLAEASLGEVLREWQGLGYNRRAKMLHECAKQITHEFRGRTPKLHTELMKLPGIGPYTAGAIMAFAYNEAVPIIETNIRTVFIHHFFHEATDVTDRDICRLIDIYLEGRKQRSNPREWYYALMDYGAHLKKTIGNENVRSKHYVKQSPFKNSDRQIRGAILRALVAHEESRTALHKKLPFEYDRIDAQLERLKKEKMIVQNGTTYTIPI